MLLFLGLKLFSFRKKKVVSLQRIFPGNDSAEFLKILLMSTTNRSKSVMIIGATGLVGSRLYELLLADFSVNKITLLGRNFPASDDPKVIKVKTDFTDLNKLKEHFQDVNVLFCCIGTTIKIAGSNDAFRKVDYEIPVRLAEVASFCGVKKFIAISSLGAELNSRNFYLRTKAEMERDVVSFPFQKVAFVRPSLLLGKRTEPRTLEKLLQFLMMLFSFLMIGPLIKYKPIRDITVAKAMNMITNSVNNQKIYESNELAWLGK